MRYPDGAGVAGEAEDCVSRPASCVHLAKGLGFRVWSLEFSASLQAERQIAGSRGYAWAA